MRGRRRRHCRPGQGRRRRASCPVCRMSRRRGCSRSCRRPMWALKNKVLRQSRIGRLVEACVATTLCSLRAAGFLEILPCGRGDCGMVLGNKAVRGGGNPMELRIQHLAKTAGGGEELIGDVPVARVADVTCRSRRQRAWHPKNAFITSAEDLSKSEDI